MTGSLSGSELATFDIDAMLRAGLAGDNDVARRNLFSIGAVGAAVDLDRAQTIPRSLTYLAEVVHAGGISSRALELPEPLPRTPQTEITRSWLTAAASIGHSVETDDLFARWLRAVTTILAIRIDDRRSLRG
ncbi:hypothetical protein [Nocardia sp. NRRL WC-3656]|uniref:hypothetical protein n=1 Tax=Nocardia sp. NRRL WC-3656 TaxID=1463824 RepID=UPI0004C45FD4|nr:hypothetical protein [Nocardia sp. NRRL WC-3656]